MKFYGNYELKREKGVKLRAINEIMWIIDTEYSENEYVKKKHGYKYDFIDKKARNTFKVGRVIISMIKYVYGYNHYGKRDKMINDYMVETICPRCELIKT